MLLGDGLSWLLDFEVLVVFELGPYEIGLLYAVGIGKPVPPVDESPHHARVVTLAHVNLQPVFVLQRRLYEYFVC